MFRKFRQVLTITLGLSVGVVMARAGSWVSLRDDGIHEPSNPGLEVLQEPSEALSGLSRDGAGNKVNWTRAITEGQIKPRHNLANTPGSEEVHETTIVFAQTNHMPLVLFPHKPHTEWLSCANCHDQIFPREAGRTPVDMLDILNGQYCGQCHGAVSFPLTECNRCHSVPQDSPQARELLKGRVFVLP